MALSVRPAGDFRISYQQDRTIFPTRGSTLACAVAILVLCLLPSKSPWLNAIEPKWVHGKRAVVEPERLLTAHELADRVCAYYGCAHEPHLAQSQKAA